MSMRLITTPGVAASSAPMSRPLGIELSCSSLKFCCTRVADVSITGDAPDTVTVSCTVASARSAFTVAVKPSEIWMPLRFTVLKPVRSKSTSYTPGGTAGNRYWPFSLVTCVCAPIIDGLVAVTVTPGNTAPLLSATRPWMVPVLLAPPPCAALVDGKANPITSAVARVFNKHLISIPPGNFVGKPHVQQHKCKQSTWDRNRISLLREHDCKKFCGLRPPPASGGGRARTRAPERI